MPIRIRGLEKGFERSPLREFKGTLDRYETRLATSETWGEMTMVDFFFKDVEVIQATEPYNFPIAQISVKYSERENSVWGIFAKSMEAVLPEGIELDNCAGHIMHMEMTPGHEFGKDRETKELIIRECWECRGVEGFEPAGSASVSPRLRALQLLDGKATPQEWHNAVFTDSKIKGDSEVMQEILTNKFLPALIEAGVVTQDEQGYHVNLAAVKA